MAKDDILSNDPKLLRSLRRLCPRKGARDVTSITFSTPGHAPVTITSETRAKIDARLRELKAQGKE